MEAENDRIHEVESVDSSPSTKEGIQQGVTEGLYRLINKKARTLLDLGGGSIKSGVLWALKRVGSNGAYRIMSLRGATYLDLESGCVVTQEEWHQEDESPVLAYNYVGEGSSRLHQEWNIAAEGEGFYTLQCAKTGTYLEIQGGNSASGTRATCSKRTPGGDHQLWDLERASRTTIEIKSIISSWKPDLLSRLFQPYDDDNEYFILPSDLRNIIWNGTKLLRQEVRRSTFDYDGFVIKAKDAVNTSIRDRLRVDVRMLAPDT
ncbi:hypothetical protein FRC01_012679, partial [Tulasnella sp. 417]